MENRQIRLLGVLQERRIAVQQQALQQQQEQVAANESDPLPPWRSGGADPAYSALVPDWRAAELRPRAQSGISRSSAAAPRPQEP